MAVQQSPRKLTEAEKIDLQYWRAKSKSINQRTEERKQRILLDKIDLLKSVLELQINSTVETDEWDETVKEPKDAPPIFEEREMRRMKQKLMLLIDKL